MPPRSPAIDRFWSKVNKDGPVPTHRPDLGACWLWLAATDGRGYGAFSDDNRRVVKAYAWAWVQEHGAVPDGLELDHVCRVKACVRPSHMEPVTHGENVRRGRLARTHCGRGHDLANARIRPRDGARICRECAREDDAAWRERNRGTA